VVKSNIIFLLSLNLRRFWVIHSQISAIPCSKFFKKEEKLNSLSGSSDIYSCASSAYEWYLTPYRCAMIPRGQVCMVKTKWPRTEPCGTPDNKNCMSNKIPWTDTLWELCSRHDRNHWSTLPDRPNMSFKCTYDQLDQMQQTGSEEYWLILISWHHNIIFHPNQGCFSVVTTFICRP